MTAAVEHRVSSLVVLSLLSLVASGCGDSSSSSDAGPVPLDQCVGASDLAIIDGLASAADGGVPDGGVPDGGPYPYSYLSALGDQISACSTAETCLPNIINDSDPEQCINDCLTTTPAVGISAGCVGCYVEIIRCTGQHCATLCLGSDEVACAACGYEHCGARTADCTGITGTP